MVFDLALTPSSLPEFLLSCLRVAVLFVIIKLYNEFVH